MKSKLLTIARLLNICLVAALTLVYSSCSETELVDSTGFTLQYYGVTDIGPSMTYTLEAPTYKGSTPHDFTITGVTLNEEAFENADYFVIDAETGAIAIQNTESIPTGLYNISVGCYSNGKFYNFKDAVQVNMLLAVPDGVTVEPAEVLVNQDEEDWAEASAQVTTEKDKHVSIIGYSIVQDESKPYLAYFNIDGKGKITINPETKDKLVAGESYVLSLKLTTGAGEHMYADAVTFKVVSKPRNLFYINQEALPDLFEVRVEGKSVVPTIEGAKDGLKFTIKSVIPETNAFIIDEATGQIMLPEGHSLEEDETPYVFTITASNDYGSTDFESVYSAQIVAFIEPIQPNTFHYTEVNQLYQLGGFLDSYTPDPGFVGGAPKYSFDESNYNDAELKEHIIEKEIITINSATGAVSIAKTHTLSVKTHEIKVRVANKKNEEGIVATLFVTVAKNPNDFTYVSWGTNLENPIEINAGSAKTIAIDTETAIEQKEENRNLFRFIHGRDVKDIVLKKIGNKNDNSTYTYEKVLNNFIGHEDIFNGITVDYQSGTIKFNKAENGNFINGEPAKNGTYTSSMGCIFQIAVTASGNDAPTVTKNIPIFISTPKVQSTKFTNIYKDGGLNYTLLCTPFVVKANPKTGACATFQTEMHAITAGGSGTQRNSSSYKGDYDKWKDNIVWDYRANFSYCNFDNNTKHGTGDNTLEGNLLQQVWSNCGVSSSTNTPFRYYNHKDENGAIDLGNNIKAAYIMPIGNGQHKLVINSEVWKAQDNKYPNGAVLGEMRFTLNGNMNEDKNTFVTQCPLIIWLDETYEGN